MTQLFAVQPDRIGGKIMRTWIVAILLALMVSAAAYAHGEREGKDDWPMYGRNLEHTFSNPHSRINSGNVADLQKAWTFVTGDAVTASPTVVDGVVYIGSWDGFFYALDARSGRVRWKFQVDCQNTLVPIPPQCLASGQVPPPRFFSQGGLITSSAAVIAGKVYFAAGKTLYSLNARDGSLRWKRVVCGNPDEPACTSDANDPAQIFSSPVVFDNMVFVGWTPGADHYRGGFAAFDSKTGAVRWRFEVDPILGANGQPLLVNGHAAGGQNRGCGSVWSSAAVDVDRHLVFFGTGDCNNAATAPFHEAVIALKSSTGQLVWAFRPRASDPKLCDFDFGAAPNLIHTDQGQYVGIGGKDGTYYLLERLARNPAGKLVWARNVVFGGNAGGFFGGAAVDESRIYSATGIGDGNVFTQTGLCNPQDPRDIFVQEPSMHALDLGGGGAVWQQPMNQSFAPAALADGVVFIGTVGLLQPPALNAYDARTGSLLRSFQMNGSVNSGATPVGDMVFVGSGNTNDGNGGGVHAFRLRKRSSGAAMP
jgi:polyvinyl alcohol dehydrogenase (cytochrome)